MKVGVRVGLCFVGIIQIGLGFKKETRNMIFGLTKTLD
jgi:hypothetical protein